MTQAANLAALAANVNASGQTSLTTGVTGTLPVANGGTGVTSPGASGNILTSNGTAWVSSTPAAGGVTSVATGNGLSGGTITSTGTLTIAAPTYGSVGSYAMAGFGGTNNSVSIYGGTTAGSNIYNYSWNPDTWNSSGLSGTWKIMNGSYRWDSGGNAITTQSSSFYLYVRVS